VRILWPQIVTVAIVCGTSLTACDPGVQELRIAAQDFRFVPSRSTLSAASAVRLVLVNEGREAHEFESPLLALPGAEVEPGGSLASPTSLRLLPGRSVEVRFHAPPGTYLFRCNIRGHAGMTGTLLVE